MICVVERAPNALNTTGQVINSVSFFKAIKLEVLVLVTTEPKVFHTSYTFWWRALHFNPVDTGTISTNTELRSCLQIFSPLRSTNFLIIDIFAASSAFWKVDMTICCNVRPQSKWFTPMTSFIEVLLSTFTYINEYICMSLLALIVVITMALPRWLIK